MWGGGRKGGREGIGAQWQCLIVVPTSLYVNLDSWCVYV